MKEIIVQVPDKKFDFFIELLRSLGFTSYKTAKADKSNSKEEVVSNVKQGLKELALVENGKIKSRPVKELLDEL